MFVLEYDKSQIISMDGATVQALANMMGSLFVNAVENGYDLQDYVEKYMNSETAHGMDQAISKFHWEGKEYLEDYFLTEINDNPVKQASREQLDNTEFYYKLAHWIGYTYIIWHYYTGDLSRDIYAKAPFEEMRRSYGYWHTQEVESFVDIFIDQPDIPFTPEQLAKFAAEEEELQKEQSL